MEKEGHRFTGGVLASGRIDVSMGNLFCPSGPQKNRFKRMLTLWLGSSSFPRIEPSKAAPPFSRRDKEKKKGRGGPAEEFTIPKGTPT